jgi:hypothetical protein
MKIGGNITAAIQIKTSTKNEYGERVPNWKDIKTVRGWIDLSNGTSDYLNYNAKVQDSTHIFICDVFDLDSVTDPDTGKTVDVTKDNARMLVNGSPYAILLIDNPMELNQQFEIYLKFMEGGA